MSEMSINVISEKEIVETIEATYRVLEEIGVDIHQEEAVTLLADAGCRVEETRVWIPRELVKKCMETVPKNIDIYNRAGNLAMQLGGRRTYFGPGPTCPNFNDPWTGKRRPAIKQDAADAAKVADACRNLDYVMSLCMIGDQTPSLADVHEIHAMLQNTSKPICGWSFNVENTRSIIDMCAAVSGGLEKFQEKPFFIMYVEPTTPLLHTKEPIETVMECAKKCVPCVYASGLMMCATAPATMPAALSIGFAESWTGLVISQLVNPGAPFITSATGGPMDMRTMNHAYGAVEFAIFNGASAEIVHYLDLPAWHTAGATDAKSIDAQAGIEAVLGIVYALGTGGNLVHDVGFSDMGMTGSIEFMLICDQIIGMSKRLYRGIEYEPGDEVFAFDVIKEVGPGGNFLTEDHTVEHYAEFCYPELIDRDLYPKWLSNGGFDMTQRATKKMQDILKNHTVLPLSEDQKTGIDRVLEEAEARVSG